jgi:hypothetical protein
MDKKKLINAENIRNFIEGNLNLLKQNTSFMKLKTHIQEQAIFRAAQCINCLELGQCTECGCATPGLFYAPSKEDPKNKWGKMLEEKEWQLYKETNNLEIPNIDLAKVEVLNTYDKNSLDALPPWDLREILSALSKKIEVAKELNNTDETKG